MDPLRLKAWLTAQIDAHAPTKSDGLATTCARLVAAASAMRPDRNARMVFGMSLPPGALTDDASYRHALRVLAQWPPFLDSKMRAEIDALAAHYDMPSICGTRSQARRVVGALDVWFPVRVEDINTSEIHESAEVLRGFDGARARAEAELLDVPWVQEAIGVREVGSMVDGKGWAMGTHAKLAFDAAACTLVACFTFDVAREPTSHEVDGFLRAMQRELFDCAWFTNLEWEAETATSGFLAPYVEHEILRHALRVKP